MKPIRLFREFGGIELGEKKEDIPDISETINKGLDEARDIGWNKAIDEAVKILWSHRFVYTGMGDMVEQIQSLKKPNQ